MGDICEILPPPQPLVPQGVAMHAACLILTGGKNAKYTSVTNGKWKYVKHNHDRPVYEKMNWQQTVGVPVLIYYWDDRDGPSFSGWWIGYNMVGSEEILGFNRSHDSMPPREGWKVPWKSSPDRSIKLEPVDPSDDIAAEEPMEPGTNHTRVDFEAQTPSKRKSRFQAASPVTGRLRPSTKKRKGETVDAYDGAKRTPRPDPPTVMYAGKTRQEKLDTAYALLVEASGALLDDAYAPPAKSSSSSKHVGGSNQDSVQIAEGGRHKHHASEEGLEKKSVNAALVDGREDRIWTRSQKLKEAQTKEDQTKEQAKLKEEQTEEDQFKEQPSAKRNDEIQPLAQGAAPVRRKALNLWQGAVQPRKKASPYGVSCNQLKEENVKVESYVCKVDDDCSDEEDEVMTPDSDVEKGEVPHEKVCIECGQGHDPQRFSGVSRRRFRCPGCRLRSMDPFNPVLEGDDGLLEITMVKESKLQYHLSLPKLQMWRRIGHRVEVRMCRLDSLKAHQVWAYPLEIKVNGHEVLSVTPPTDVQKRRDEPYNISANLAVGANTLEINVLDECRERYAISVVRTSYRLPQHLWHLVKRLSEEESRQHIIEILKNTCGNSAPTSGSKGSRPNRLDLLCPLNGRRIETPVRGWQCQHMQCFDLEAYLVSNQSIARSFNSRWKCPLCKIVIKPPHGLYVDAYCARILRRAKTGVDAVDINPSNLKWTLLTRRELRKERGIMTLRRVRRKAHPSRICKRKHVRRCKKEGVSNVGDDKKIQLIGILAESPLLMRIRQREAAESASVKEIQGA